MAQETVGVGDYCVIRETGELALVLRISRGLDGVVIVNADGETRAFEPHELWRWGHP